jgi:signal transduction histidine kinase
LHFLPGKFLSAFGRQALLEGFVNPRFKNPHFLLFLRILVLFFLQYVLGKWFLNLSVAGGIEISGWSSLGLALAAFVIWGYKVWPGIFLGAIFTNLSAGLSLGFSMGLAAAKTLEEILAAYLVRRFANGRHAFDRPRDVLVYFLVAGVGVTALGAFLGRITLHLGAYQSLDIRTPVWLTWWLGGMAKNLVVAPLLIIWANQPRVQWSRINWLEEGFLLIFIVLISETVFTGMFFPGGRRHSMSFLCIPPLIYAAYRFGQRETATATAILAGIAVWNTMEGRGPFLGEGMSVGTSLLVLQVFLSVTAIIPLLLSSALSEEKRTLEGLKKAKEELLRSNNDLDQFANVAAHDLQEPLRMVVSYMQLVKDKYKDQLDSDGKEFIDFAVNGGKRMQALLLGLLEYARVGSKGKEFEPVSFEEVFGETAANLKIRIEELGARLTHGPLPVVMGERIQLIQLLQNLFANALKFHGPEKPEVRLTARKKGKEWIFECQDNGIGIDPKYFERIFIVFQRLHTREEYEGMGVGLAVCRKIVERHGGRIWVESKIGKGSRFYFTLP